jgi:hypothetical protein
MRPASMLVLIVVCLALLSLPVQATDDIPVSVVGMVIGDFQIVDGDGGVWRLLKNDLGQAVSDWLGRVVAVDALMIDAEPQLLLVVAYELLD